MDTLQRLRKYATMAWLEEVEFEFFKKIQGGMSAVKPDEVKQEYRLQQWREMVREQKESSLTVRQ